MTLKYGSGLLSSLGAKRITYIIHSHISKVEIYEFIIATRIFRQKPFPLPSLTYTAKFEKRLTVGIFMGQIREMTGDVGKREISSAGLKTRMCASCLAS